MLSPGNGLLAAAEPVGALGRYLNRAGSLRENLLFILFGAAIVSLWVGLFLWERYRKRRPEKLAEKIILFDELCAAHALTADEIAGLREIAKLHQHAEPALLFVQPERWQALPQQRPDHAARYEHLRGRLFG